MSHFYGLIKGTKGEATRCGHKSSGLSVTAASYSGCVRVYLHYSEELDADIARVAIEPWQGSGVNIRLYDGPIHPPPPSDVDQALRCQTCINYNKWSPIGCNGARP